MSRTARWPGQLVPASMIAIVYPTAGPAVRPYRGQMLTPPDDLPAAALVSALGHSWGMAVASMDPGRRLGHHPWEVADAAGARWFVTADGLEYKRRSEMVGRIVVRLTSTSPRLPTAKFHGN